MPTTRKRETVKELQHLFTDSQVLIFTDYRGLKVSDITNLRRQLREKGVEYHVAKNTLTTLAASRSGLEELGALLDGPTAIAFVNDDIQGAAKVLNDFVRTSRILQIRGGLMGHTFLNPDQVSDLTKLLTRDQYIAQALGTMQSPISNLLNVLNGTIRGFMNVMQARMDQLKEQGDTGAVPEAEAATSTTAEAPTPEAETATQPEAEAPQAMASANAEPGGEVEAVTPPAETAETPGTTEASAKNTEAESGGAASE